MTENMIWLFCVGGSGILFILIGVYAMLRKKPMWFWSGTTVPPASLIDVRGYNRENGIMWMIYGLPFIIFGFTFFLVPTLSTVLLIIFSIGSIPLLILNYRRICNKYSI